MLTILAQSFGVATRRSGSEISKENSGKPGTPEKIRFRAPKD
ncbi:hypothetical protein [Roseivivax sp. CAU 1753]